VLLLGRFEQPSIKVIIKCLSHSFTKSDLFGNAGALLSRHVLASLPGNRCAGLPGNLNAFLPGDLLGNLLALLSGHVLTLEKKANIIFVPFNFV
jgi:hypothetical protein